jgi:hypothetical protein
MAKDARKAARNKIGSKAWVKLDGGFSVRPCTVVDLSNRGVQLRIDNPSMVSDPFVLVMSRANRTGRRCRVKWRNGGQVGAQFSGE